VESAVLKWVFSEQAEGRLQWRVLMVGNFHLAFFWGARSKDCEKRLLVASCLPVRPPACNNSAPSWRIFMKFDIWVFFFSKSVGKIQVSSKSNNNNGTLHEYRCTFRVISRWILLRVKNIADKICREIQNDILCSMKLCFPRKSCRSWDNVEKYCTAGQATDDNMPARYLMLQAHTQNM